MAQEEGLVTGISEAGWAEVVTKRSDACGDCGASRCCASLGSSSRMVVRAWNSAGAKKGDLVTLSLSSASILKSAAIFYVIPLTGLLAGAVAGHSLSRSLPFDETGGAILFVFVGLILGFGLSHLISSSISFGNKLTPVITRIIKTDVMTPEIFTPVDPADKMTVGPEGTHGGDSE